MTKLLSDDFYFRDTGVNPLKTAINLQSSQAIPIQKNPVDDKSQCFGRDR